MAGHLVAARARPHDPVVPRCVRVPSHHGGRRYDPHAGRQRKLIAKIDAALARLEEGTYGYCEVTGEPIALKRLEARPIATLTVEAQEQHEKKERVYRDD